MAAALPSSLQRPVASPDLYPAGRHRSGSAVTLWGRGFHSSLTLWDPDCHQELSLTSQGSIITQTSGGVTESARDLYADYVRFEGQVIFKLQHVPAEMTVFRHYFVSDHTYYRSVMCHPP